MLKPLDYNMGFISDVILHESLQNYCIDKYTVYPYVNLDNTIVSTNRLSETSRKAVIKDSNGKLYFLKEIPWYIKSENHASDIVRFQYELSKRSIPVPTVYQSRNNEHITCVQNHKLYLQQFIHDGILYEGRPEQIFSAGFQLGRLQIEAAKIHNHHCFELPFNTIFDSTKNVLVLLLKKFLSKRSEISKHEQEMLLEFVNKSKSFISLFESQYFDLDPPNASITHGDFNPINLIFAEGDTVRAIIDFDNVYITDPLSDLAEGLLTFSGMVYKQSSSRFEKIEALHYEKFEQFINGYSEHVDISPNMRRILPLSITTIYIKLISLGLIRGDWYISDIQGFIDNINEVLTTSNEFLKM